MTLTVKMAHALSTSGVVPEIPPMAKKPASELVSRMRWRTRKELVPLNKKYPIANYRRMPQMARLSNAKRITFEYVMLKDVNDSDDDARALVNHLPVFPPN